MERSGRCSAPAGGAGTSRGPCSDILGPVMMLGDALTPVDPAEDFKPADIPQLDRADFDPYNGCDPRTLDMFSMLRIAKRSQINVNIA